MAHVSSRVDQEYQCPVMSLGPSISSIFSYFSSYVTSTFWMFWNKPHNFNDTRKIRLCWSRQVRQKISLCDVAKECATVRRSPSSVDLRYLRSIAVPSLHNLKKTKSEQELCNVMAIVYNQVSIKCYTQSTSLLKLLKWRDSLVHLLPSQAPPHWGGLDFVGQRLHQLFV